MIPTFIAPHVTATVSTKSVDTRSQYRVQANDSLYRISVRLYGKADHVEKLYADNKELIGADPKHLKSGTVLKLSEQPTVTAPIAL